VTEVRPPIVCCDFLRPPNNTAIVLNSTWDFPNTIFVQMTDFERIQQELELQRLEAEIQEKRQMISRQKEALSLLEPLLVSLLGQAKVVTLEPDPVHLNGLGVSFQNGRVQR
jgi:hypothetical protein